MISQSQMNEWVHKAVEHFQAVMPPIDALYPEYRIVTDGTVDTIRQTLLEKTGSQTFICTDVASMETLHGPRGNAILVYQELFNALLSGDDGEEIIASRSGLSAPCVFIEELTLDDARKYDCMPI